MTPPPDQTPPWDPSGPAFPAAETGNHEGETPSPPDLDPLDRLADALKSQQSDLARQDLQALKRSTQRVDSILAELAGQGLTADQRLRLSELKELHLKTRLSLAARMQDISKRIARLRRGRRALDAYRP